jgi:hypothetical protein
MLADQFNGLYPKDYTGYGSSPVKQAFAKKFPAENSEESDSVHYPDELSNRVFITDFAKVVDFIEERHRVNPDRTLFLSQGSVQLPDA